jgi:hypothetical protein
MTSAPSSSCADSRHKPLRFVNGGKSFPAIFSMLLVQNLFHAPSDKLLGMERDARALRDHPFLELRFSGSDRLRAIFAGLLQRIFGLETASIQRSFAGASAAELGLV